MTHEQVLERLPDLVRGTLDQHERETVVEHLDACSDCSEALATLRLLAADEPRVASLVSHPASEEIVEFARRRGRSDRARAIEIDEHVGHCASCRQEVQDVEQAIAVPRRGPIRSALGGWPISARAGFAAASLVALALVYPAVQGLRRSPDQPPVHLRAAYRGASPETVVRILPDQKQVSLAVEFDPPTPTASGTGVVFDIVAVSGPTVYSASMDLARAARSVREEGFVLVPIPTATMAGGVYDLRVSQTEEAGHALLTLIRFRVDRPAP